MRSFEFIIKPFFINNILYLPALKEFERLSEGESPFMIKIFDKLHGELQF
jgi:hypothetical protein